MKTKSLEGFTLIELMVVIAIIGILAGILISSFSGGSESARNARCLTNLKNLASACQTYSVNSSAYPLAGSKERYSITVTRRSGRSSRANEQYHEVKGWVSWYSQGVYKTPPSKPAASSGWNLSTYEVDEDKRTYCLTNGAIWKCVANRDVFRCPSHVRTKTNPNWSYVMNSYFGWTAKPGEDILNEDEGGINYSGLTRADRRLLFAEIPFTTYAGVVPPDGTGPGYKCDCVLQYKGTEGVSENETIGFNHRMGKKQYCAHVVFADGHTEKLVFPKGGMTQTEQEDLTAWLCKGYDVSFDGKTYDTMVSGQK